MTRWRNSQVSATSKIRLTRSSSHFSNPSPFCQITNEESLCQFFWHARHGTGRKIRRVWEKCTEAHLVWFLGEEAQRALSVFSKETLDRQPDLVGGGRAGKEKTYISMKPEEKKSSYFCRKFGTTSFSNPRKKYCGAESVWCKSFQKAQDPHLFLHLFVTFWTSQNKNLDCVLEAVQN